MRTLYTKEGVAYIECARTPASPRYEGFNVHYGRALLIMLVIKCYDDHKGYLITDRYHAECL